MNLKHQKSQVNKFYLSLRKILKKKNKKFFLHEPTLDKLDKKYVAKCIDSKVISTAGDFTKKFEVNLKKFTRAKYVLSTISGTSALHLSLISLGIKKDDEVLLPSLTFVATGNAILYNNAIPHFVDIDENLSIDFLKLENYLKKISFIKNGKCINKKNKRVIKAIIPMHTFGHLCDPNKLLKLAKKFKLSIIEDAAEALGSFYKNNHAGTFGDMGVLSFNGNKILTTGMGGAILTRNKRLYEKAKHLAATAKVKSRWDYIHDEIGYNYRLPSLNASLGCAQIKKIKNLLQKKRKLFYRYQKSFSKITFLDIFKERPNIKSNYWLQTVILKKNKENLLKPILKKCHDNGLFVRPSWRPLHRLKFFKKYPKMNLDNTNSLSKRIINLPSSSFLIK
tara:strand:- start:3946 stop:5124 length:1179 start_codon:yes stop_codon:yes gene_type:complete